MPDQIVEKSELVDKCDSKFKSFINDRNELTQPERTVTQKSRLFKSNEIYRCNICDKKLKNKYTLKHHNKKIHNIFEAKHSDSNSELKPHNFKCDICSKSYVTKFSLGRHFKNNHTADSPKKPRSITKRRLRAFKCDKCESSFSREKSLKYHARRKHSISNFELKSFKCPICNESFHLRKVIVKHITLRHDIKLSNDSYKFPSYEKFLKWKNKIETETNCKYIRYGNLKPSVNGDKLYFKCHRSGYYNTTGIGVRPWQQKTYKINAFCPAVITTLKLKSGGYEINFQSIHVGHDNNLENLFFKAKSKKRSSRKSSNIILATEALPPTNIKDELLQGSDSNLNNDHHTNDPIAANDSDQELEHVKAELEQNNYKSAREKKSSSYNELHKFNKFFIKQATV